MPESAIRIGSVMVEPLNNMYHQIKYMYMVESKNKVNNFILQGVQLKQSDSKLFA